MALVELRITAIQDHSHCYFSLVLFAIATAANISMQQYTVGHKKRPT